ncbi:hypothetical protein FB480_103153 [Agrobacterium vitis]|nr:hypothetical protein FB480_103153 [Agrobacterium vitis]
MLIESRCSLCLTLIVVFGPLWSLTIAFSEAVIDI